MLELTIKSVPYYDIEPYEVLKKGVSYTYETVQYLRKKHSLEKVHWLMGDDTFLSFHKWYRWKDLLRFLEPIVMLRTSESDEIENYAKTVLGLNTVRTYKGRKIEISSTEIRERAKGGLDIRFMVPYEVYLYIKKKNLYR
jgi:nicotinate-nucleotide adenylyltransferase